jgi:hypothetical protein
MDYIRTMSFSQGGTSLQTSYSPDYTFSAKLVTGTIVTNTTWTDLPFPLELSDPSGSYNNSTYTYSFNTNTYDYSIKVTFKTSVYINGLGENESFYLQIIKSTDNFITSQSLELELPGIPESSYYTNTSIPPTQYIDTDSEGKFYVATNGTSSAGYMNYISTVPQVFESGSKVKVRYKVGTTGTGTASVTILGSSPNTLNTSFLSTTNYSNALEITSSYWLGALNFPTSSNAVQGLIATLPFSNILNPQSTFTQLNPTSSLGFNTINHPSHILPGDYIRFEYDKTKQSKVYSVQSIPGGYVYLEINPPVPSGSILDHFTVYRINPNAGNQIILDVPKPTGTTGQPLTGFIKPQHMSKELEDNFITIIQKLAAEGLLT